MSQKRALKRPVVEVPQNLNQASEFVRRISETRRAIDEIQANLNQEVETLKAKAMAETKPQEENATALLEGLFAFAESRRNELTDGGKRKTVDLATGTIAWRMTPPAVSLRSVEKVIAELKRRGLRRFIRIKEEVDKEAMLKEREEAEGVKGVTIGQHEEFVVKPAELKVEIVAEANKLKKAVA